MVASKAKSLPAKINKAAPKAKSSPVKAVPKVVAAKKSGKKAAPKKAAAAPAAKKSGKKGRRDLHYISMNRDIPMAIVQQPSEAICTFAAKPSELRKIVDKDDFDALGKYRGHQQIGICPRRKAPSYGGSSVDRHRLSATYGGTFLLNKFMMDIEMLGIQDALPTCSHCAITNGYFTPLVSQMSDTFSSSPPIFASGSSSTRRQMVKCVSLLYNPISSRPVATPGCMRVTSLANLVLLFSTTFPSFVLTQPQPDERPDWTEEAQEAVDRNALLFRGGGSATQGAIGARLRPQDLVWWYRNGGISTSITPDGTGRMGKDKKANIWTNTPENIRAAGFEVHPDAGTRMDPQNPNSEIHPQGHVSIKIPDGMAPDGKVPHDPLLKQLTDMRPEGQPEGPTTWQGPHKADAARKLHTDQEETRVRGQQAKKGGTEVWSAGIGRCLGKRGLGGSCAIRSKEKADNFVSGAKKISVVKNSKALEALKADKARVSSKSKASRSKSVISKASKSNKAKVIKGKARNSKSLSSKTNSRTSKAKAVSKSKTRKSKGVPSKANKTKSALKSKTRKPKGLASKTKSSKSKGLKAGKVNKAKTTTRSKTRKPKGMQSKATKAKKAAKNNASKSKNARKVNKAKNGSKTKTKQSKSISSKAAKTKKSKSVSKTKGSKLKNVFNPNKVKMPSKNKASKSKDVTKKAKSASKSRNTKSKSVTKAHKTNKAKMGTKARASETNKAGVKSRVTSKAAKSNKATKSKGIAKSGTKKTITKPKGASKVIPKAKTSNVNKSTTRAKSTAKPPARKSTAPKAKSSPAKFNKAAPKAKSSPAKAAPKAAAKPKAAAPKKAAAAPAGRKKGRRDLHYMNRVQLVNDAINAYKRSFLEDA
ncbi:14397_t:CDS:2 [Acaulospora colombiana]|uniref:14397_t:CDS:1 n=1 Tax=Acaulospora colombiana TaxID=27376 RepID=A0ACA9MLP0_9GLOM|nr:14397_t:CDS:2 [Acaulospora colombiana]